LTEFKPFRLRYIMIDCWPIEVTDLNGSVLKYGEVKIDLGLLCVEEWYRVSINALS
jgi:hypothetical protein